MEMSAGMWIDLHIPELKSPLAPGFGQTGFLLGRPNKHLRLTLLTWTAPMCPVATLDAWDVQLGNPPPTALLLSYHSGHTYRVFNMSWQEGTGGLHQCPYTWLGPPPQAITLFFDWMMIIWLVNTWAVDLPCCWICEWQVLTGIIKPVHDH